MASDVAARILEEGLISRQELSEALAESSGTSCLVARIVDRGVDAERVLALFEGQFGLPVGPVALAGVPAALTMRVPGAMAHSFFALPVAQGPDFVVVAMADPSDEHAVEELERILEQPVQARPARVGDLRQALIRAYPESEGPLTSFEGEGSPVELTRARRDSSVPIQLVRPKESSKDTSKAVAEVVLTPKTPEAPQNVPEDIETADALPLNRPKGPSEASSSRPAKTFRRPTPAVDDNSWADLDRQTAPSTSAGGVELGPMLAAIRDAPARDEIVRAGAEAARHFARSAVLLTLRRGVLRGWEARGEGVSTDAIRNLWIPATNPSMFRSVVDAKDTHKGPYGGSAADHLYRAAIGSRGGNVEIHPIAVQGTVVAVLCADDPAEDPTESLDVIAHAMGEALARLVKSD